MTTKTKVEILEGTLDLLNSPERWAKGVLHCGTPNTGEAWCLIGAINQVAFGIWTWVSNTTPEYGELVSLLDAMAKERGYLTSYTCPANGIVYFNNAPETEYEDVRLFLKEALERVRSELDE